MESGSFLKRINALASSARPKDLKVDGLRMISMVKKIKF